MKEYVLISRPITSRGQDLDSKPNVNLYFNLYINLTFRRRLTKRVQLYVDKLTQKYGILQKNNKENLSNRQK